MPSVIPLTGTIAGRGAVRLARTVRVREVRGSNPRAPTETPLQEGVSFIIGPGSPLRDDANTPCGAHVWAPRQKTLPLLRGSVVLCGHTMKKISIALIFKKAPRLVRGGVCFIDVSCNVAPILKPGTIEVNPHFC